MPNPREIINKKLNDILATVPDLPERDPCDCGAGMPELSYDFDGHTWFVWCGECSQASDSFSYPDLAIEDFNKRNKGGAYVS